MILPASTPRNLMAGVLACIAAATWAAEPLQPTAGLPLTAALSAEATPAIPLTAALEGEVLPLRSERRLMAQAQPAAAAPKSSTASDKASASVPLASIKADQKGEFVQVEGTPSNYKASGNPRAPHSFQLKDSAGTTLRVAIWDDVFSGLPADTVAAIRDGAGTLKMRAKVNVFKEQVELHPGAGDVTVAGSGSAPKAAAPAVAKAPVSADGSVAPGSITKADMGKVVTVKARVESARKPTTERAPFVLKLSGESGGGSIDLVFWTDTQKAIPTENQAEPGDMVTVKGKVSEHRGSLQLQLESPADLKVTERGGAGKSSQSPQSAAPAKSVTVAEMGKQPAGTRIQVEATIVESTPVTLGHRLTVADPKSPTEKGTVLFYDSALRPDHRPEAGKTLTLSGSIAALDNGDPVLVVAP